MPRVFHRKYLGRATFLWPAVFFLSFVPLEAHGQIIISEVQIRGETANDEFVELFNAGADHVSLLDWELRRKTKGDTSERGSLFHKFHEPVTLAPGQYLLWTNKEGRAGFIALADAQSKNKTSPSLTDNNSLGLFESAGALVASVTWGADHRQPFSVSVGANPGPQSSLQNYQGTWTLSDKPTPTNSAGQTDAGKEESPAEENTGDEIVVPPLETVSSLVRLNEVFPNPQAKGDAGEFVEFYNAGPQAVSLAGWKLRLSNVPDDGRGKSEQGFDALAVIEAGGYWLLEDGKNLTVTLANQKKRLELVDAAGRLVDAMEYQSTKEDVSLNFTLSGWRGSKHLTPGAPNILNQLPTTKERVPKKAYKNVPAKFRARGSDKDGEALKYVWDFGDGRKSYKEETTHTYKEKGTYTVTLKTSDGSDDTLETFTLTVESFPERKLRIRAILPNPAGKDTAGEWIVIENKEKKSVDLQGYSIATGSSSDKVTNHPIRESVVIKKKSRGTLTREHALFTLPNKKGRVELRAPDGTVIDKVKYKLEKSAEEDMAYVEEAGKDWEWKKNSPPIPASGTQPDPPIAEPETPMTADGVVLGAAIIVETPSEDPLIVPETARDSLIPSGNDPNAPAPFSREWKYPPDFLFAKPVRSVAPLPHTLTSVATPKTISFEEVFTSVNSFVNTLLNRQWPSSRTLVQRD